MKRKLILLAVTIVFLAGFGALLHSPPSMIEDVYKRQELGRHRMQEILKMMRQGMKVEILPGMRTLEVRMILPAEQMQDPDLDPGVVRRFLWM